MNRWIKFTAFLLTLVFLSCAICSCTPRNGKVVGTCGEHEILYEELRFEALTYLEKHPDCTEDELRAAVEQAISERYAVTELCKQYLPSASMESDEMKELAESEREKAIAALGSKKDFKAYLEEIYATKNLFDRLLILTQMQIDLETVIFAETELKNADTLLTWLKDGNCVRARRLAFSSLDRATAVRTELLAGEEIDNVLESAEDYSVSQPDYYFRNLNQTSEEAAALSLAKAGDVSEVLESDGKFVLILRVEDNYENLENYQINSVLDRYRENRLAPMIEEAAKGLPLSWTKQGEKLVLKDID